MPNTLVINHDSDHSCSDASEVFATGAAEFMPMMIKQQKTSGWVAIPVIDGITMTV